MIRRTIIARMDTINRGDQQILDVHIEFLFHPREIRLSFEFNLKTN